MAKVIMVQGTMSNAGKSLVVAGLCRIFQQDGYKVAPFKSQNMALNSYITEDGLEMGRAQVMQAEAAKIKPSVYMNPILLKPTNDVGSQVIVNGKALGNMPAREYFKYKKKLIPDIIAAFQKLSEEVDIIVIEGAGSPAEINLKKDDIVNMGLAKLVDAPVLLVGDIDRGGVFAQLLGTLMLLEEDEKKRVKGLIINKFRGDKTILDPGIDMLEEKGEIPVCGVLPYIRISVDDEDSLSERLSSRERGAVNIAVIRLPRISNFTDFSAFEQVDGVKVIYVDSPHQLEDADLVILPGSKNTIGDLKWLRESGMEAKIKKFSKDRPVIGICGGYQMLGNLIEDPEHVEEGGSIRGMELLPITTVLRKEKQTTQVKGSFGAVGGIFQALSDKSYTGYEIHMGETKIAEIAEILEPSISGHSEEIAEIAENTKSFTENGYAKGNVYGSYVHGLFDEGNIAYQIALSLAEKKGVELKEQTLQDYQMFKESQYDLLAEEMRKHMDMDAIYQMLSIAHWEEVNDSVKKTKENSSLEESLDRNDLQGYEETSVDQKASTIKIKDLLTKKSKIAKIDSLLEQKIKKNWDAVAKPLDSMGEFEKLLARIGSIQQKESPELSKTALVVMCADNGIVEEGVSQSPQSVTAMCAKNIALGKSSVGMMASHVGACIETVDIGMNTKEEILHIRNKKVMEGTKNFYKEPAMTKEQALQGIQIGMDMVRELKEKGMSMVATGEMGIGNTTTSSAMAAALLNLPVDMVTGRGAGLSDQGLLRKQKVIEEALMKYHFNKDTDPLTILSTVGGLDIAGLVGICIGGAVYEMPVLLDGIISNVAALTAEKLVTGVKDYFIPSHTSKEPAALMIQDALSLRPVIHAGMALGEGTGAMMMLSLLQTANEVYVNSFTFDEYGLEQYKR